MALAALGRVMTGNRPWTRLTLWIAGGALVVTLGVGGFSLANDTLRSALWQEIKSLFCLTRSGLLNTLGARPHGGCAPSFFPIAP